MFKKNNILLENEVNKLTDVLDFYKKVLYSIDIYKPDIIDHIRNIRHYIDLLDEHIENLNSYAIMNKIPVCNEQIERDNSVNATKQIFNQFMIYAIINGNIS